LIPATSVTKPVSVTRSAGLTPSASGARQVRSK
jgi:hypothetical protein